jgi:hypothetical protein
MKEISIQEAQDILATAAEGGINYWINDDEICTNRKVNLVRDDNGEPLKDSDPHDAYFHYQSVSFDSNCMIEPAIHYEVTDKLVQEKWPDFMKWCKTNAPSFYEDMNNAQRDPEYGSDFDYDAWFADLYFQWICFGMQVFN